jgi:TPR repeat protein
MEQEIIKILGLSNWSYVKIENQKSIEIIYNLLKNNIFDNSVIYDDPIIYLYAGYYYKKQKEYDLMKKYYIMAIKLGNSMAMNNLGYYYKEQKEYDSMKKYYMMAIELGNSTAMFNFGDYHEHQKEYDLMKKYYIMAIDKGNPSAMYNLGDYYYYTENKLGIAVKYLRMAKDSGHAKAQSILNEINNKFDI